MSDREDVHELVTELREKDDGEDWRACDWHDVVRVYDYQQARIEALEKVSYRIMDALGGTRSRWEWGLSSGAVNALDELRELTPIKQEDLT